VVIFSSAKDSGARYGYSEILKTFANITPHSLFCL